MAKQCADVPGRRHREGLGPPGGDAEATRSHCRQRLQVPGWWLATAVCACVRTEGRALLEWHHRHAV